MGGSRASARRARRAAAAAAAALVALAAWLGRGACGPGSGPDATRAHAAAERGETPRDVAGVATAAASRAAEVEAREVGAGPIELGLPFPSPSAGWEEAAEAVTAELARLLEARPRQGAYAEARAEAARRDLALFPPGRDRVRALLVGSERERLLALAALAARPPADDELASLVLRSQRREDDDVVRLLGAEIAAALPPELLARHEEELLRAFAAEPNPLVLAVALPALERMDGARLAALLRAQIASAPAEMLPVLLALARGRLAPGAIEDLETALAALVGGG